MPKSFIVLPNLVTLTEKVEHICLSLVKAELLSAAKGQRPRNYLSCCCSFGQCPINSHHCATPFFTLIFYYYYFFIFYLLLYFYYFFIFYYYLNITYINIPNYL